MKYEMLEEWINDELYVNCWVMVRVSRVSDGEWQWIVYPILNGRTATERPDHGVIGFSSKDEAKADAVRSMICEAVNMLRRLAPKNAWELMPSRKESAK